MSIPEATDIVTPSIATKEPVMRKAEFHRDMRRLADLRRQYDTRGLNTYEGNEVSDLLEKYDIEYSAWTRREMFADD